MEDTPIPDEGYEERYVPNLERVPYYTFWPWVRRTTRRGVILSVVTVYGYYLIHFAVKGF